jgi:hypothetical protein
MCVDKTIIMVQRRIYTKTYEQSKEGYYREAALIISLTVARDLPVYSREGLAASTLDKPPAGWWLSNARM